MSIIRLQENSKYWIYSQQDTKEKLFQIGEEYWTLINRDGTFWGGRCADDFIQFDDGGCSDLKDAFVAYWIVDDNLGHYEAFGHAYMDGEQVCARFVDRHGTNKRLCGGFRVLSKKYGTGRNPFTFVRGDEATVDEAVGYLGQNIAKIINQRTNEGFYGTAKLADKTAQGIDREGEKFEITCDFDALEFENNVYILTMNTGVSSHQPKTPPSRSDENRNHQDNDLTYEDAPWRRQRPVVQWSDNKWRSFPDK